MSRRARISRPELSDDEELLSEPGYHNPSYPKTWTEISTQTPTWGIPLAGFWNDQKIWIFLGIFVFFQILTGMTMVYFKNSLENNIANLKSCQKREANTDGSLSCSDCMCIATDGFSSKGFSDIINTQKLQEANYKKLKSQLLVYENELIELKNQLSEYENTNKNYFTEILEENWNRKNESLVKEIDEKVVSLNSSLINVVKGEVKAYSKNIQSQFDQQHRNITENKGKIQQIEEWQARFNERMEASEAQTKNLEKNIQKLEENQPKIEKQLKNVTNHLHGVDGQLNYVFSEMSEINLYIILFLVLVVIAGIFAVQKLLPLRQPSLTTDRRASPAEARDPSMRSGPRVGGKEQSHTAIYSTLSSKTRVRGISIISFHSATQKFHQKLLEAVSLPQTLPLQAYLIENQEDLLKVNPYMITIIFVDFNERNIILENPEIEVGDHRRYTTEIFLQLGCDVFVIYCKDKDSQSLPRDQLYSTKLHSINQHATLAKLKKKNRVFSVHASLHPQQVKLLEDCFKQL